MRFLLLIAWLIFILVFTNQGASVDMLALCTTLAMLGIFWPGGKE